MSKLIALTGPSTFTPQCIKMIEECLGMNFVLLYQEKQENIGAWLKKCDGVVLAGGSDIHPSIYAKNIQPNQGLTKFNYSRDTKELSIIDYCFSNKIPTLGICRGHQLMCIYKGLKNHFVMDLDGTTIHQPGKHNITLQINEPCHSINLLDPSVFKIPQPKERSLPRDLKIDKEENDCTAWVNSWHHQGVQYLGKKHEKEYETRNIKVLATAESGMENTMPIIELMMGTNDENHWITAQWHPESDWEESTASRQVIEMYKEIILTK